MSSPPPVLNPEIERALETQIAPWLEHMRWRSDFAEWRQRRLWQENYQRDAVEQVRRIAELHASAKNGFGNKARVLDLGAGMGGFAVAMLRAGERIIAFDYNFAYCEIARTRALRYDLNLPALVGAGEQLPFADASFHIVTCWDVLEHVQNPAGLLGEISRVLDEGGIAFMSAINRLAWIDPHYHLRGVNYLPREWGEKYIAWRQRTKQSELRDRQHLSDMHYFTYSEFQRLAAQFHFRVEDLNKSRSRFNKYPRPLGDFLYDSWRTFGMGTYHLVLYKLPAPKRRVSKALDETFPTPQAITAARNDR
ncbi:MAG TPA: class I SAM-dependent methyltransferase [Anaerolineae bacterium]|nr:class I SAM-dependent methyltransferase [Anaerolineae bacterium]